MHINENKNLLLIGTGGSKPGVWALLLDCRSFVPILSLPPGHSVYALDLDPEGERFAIGDRSGNIQVFSWTGMSAASPPERLFHLTQGAPVLSVCLVNDSMLASSDTQGRCLIWHPMEDEDHPTSLEGDGYPICSISRIDEGRIAGLSAGGSLLIWDSDQKRRIGSIACPRPPHKIGFVKLIHWPEQDAMVYPIEEGSLAVITLSTLDLEVQEAHEGSFYACIINEKRIHTIGSQDGCVKTWTWADAGIKLTQTGSAPSGVVSGEILDALSEEFLLINDEGEASVYRLDGGSSRLIRRMEGNHYRVAAGPAGSARHYMEERRRIVLCQSLRDQAIERINADPTEDLEDLYSRIIEAGFEAVAIGLRAHQAYLQDDLIEERRARHRLLAIMPEPDRDSLYRYATLLMKAWCITEAKKIFNQIKEEASSNSEWLENAARALGGKGCVLEPDLPIPILIDAATILDRPFTGRWVVETAPPIPFPDESIEAEILADQYEEVKTADHLENLPGAEAQSPWWIAEGSMRKTEVVVFADPSNRNKPGFRWAIQIVKSDMGCNLVPTVLFDTGPKSPDQPPGEHNRIMRTAYEEIAGQDGSWPWPRRLLQAVTHTVRRLRTRARCCREWKRC